MTTFFGWVARAFGVLALLVATGLPVAALAHGSSAGELQLDHPYAVPSAPGESQGKAFLRGIKNTGKHADRLLGASTPMAAQVKLQRLVSDADGQRGLPVDAIDLPAGSTTLLRHTGDYQLLLIDLKQPLKDGERFDLTLNFEHAGRQTVKVWVQTPRDPVAAKP